jgi:hypothetical protein
MSTTQRFVIVTLIGALVGSLAAFWYVRRAPAPAPRAESGVGQTTPARDHNRRHGSHPARQGSPERPAGLHTRHPRRPTEGAVEL